MAVCSNLDTVFSCHIINELACRMVELLQASLNDVVAIQVLDKNDHARF